MFLRFSFLVCSFLRKLLIGGTVYRECSYWIMNCKDWKWSGHVLIGILPRDMPADTEENHCWPQYSQWSGTDLNPVPPVYKSRALPLCHIFHTFLKINIYRFSKPHPHICLCKGSAVFFDVGTEYLNITVASRKSGMDGRWISLGQTETHDNH